MKRGVEFPGPRKVKAGIERHPAMIRENQMDGCLLAKMAQQRIRSYTADVKAWVHLHHDQRHLGPECHLRHLVTGREVKALK